MDKNLVLNERIHSYRIIWCTYVYYTYICISYRHDHDLKNRTFLTYFILSCQTESYDKYDDKLNLAHLNFTVASFQLTDIILLWRYLGQYFY